MGLLQACGTYLKEGGKKGGITEKFLNNHHQIVVMQRVIDEDKYYRRPSDYGIELPLSSESISLKEAFFPSGISGHGIYVSKDLSLSGGFVKGDVSLGFTTIDGTLNLDNMRITGNLSLPQSYINNLNLSGTIIEGSVNLLGSEIRGTLNMRETIVEEFFLPDERHTDQQIKVNRFLFSDLYSSKNIISNNPSKNQVPFEALKYMKKNASNSKDLYDLLL